MRFVIEVRTKVGFLEDILFIEKDFKTREDAEWWCDSQDIDHEFESVTYTVQYEVT